MNGECSPLLTARPKVAPQIVRIFDVQVTRAHSLRTQPVKQSDRRARRDTHWKFENIERVNYIMCNNCRYKNLHIRVNQPY